MKLNETKDIHGTISEAYRLDAPLIEKWLNVAGSGFEACVKDQVDALSKLPTLKFYRVEEGDEFIGYFGQEENGRWMSTIFIVPKFRPRKPEFLKAIRSVMEPVFLCGGYEKNEPACRFYRKFGKEVGKLPTPGGPITVFEFKEA